MSDRRPLKERQAALAVRAKAGDQAAMSELLKTMEGLVVFLSNQAARGGRVARDDLQAQARMGVLEALRKFDPDIAGSNFAGFAFFFMKNALRRQDRDIGYDTSAAKSRPEQRIELKLLARVRHWESHGFGRKRAIELAAVDIDVDPEHAAEAFARRQPGKALRAGDDENAGFELVDEQPPASDKIQALDVQWLIASVMNSLDPAHADLLRARHRVGEDGTASLDSLAAKKGVSREGVRRRLQLAEAAFRDEIARRGLTLEDLL